MFAAMESCIHHASLMHTGEKKALMFVFAMLIGGSGGKYWKKSKSLSCKTCQFPAKSKRQERKGPQGRIKHSR